VKPFRLAALAGALAAGSACNAPDTYADAVECAGWFDAARKTDAGQDPSFWPGWAVLDARDLGSALGKSRSDIDRDLKAARARHASVGSRTSAQILDNIKQSDSIAGRCWHHYN
jgi:hypothetical protein